MDHKTEVAVQTTVFQHPDMAPFALWICVAVAALVLGVLVALGDRKDKDGE